jgi:ABC-type antimicrobial peptide transport system permease subunit
MPPGVPLALWMSRYAKTLLFGVTTADPAILAISIGALIAVAALAGFLPARRASKWTRWWRCVTGKAHEIFVRIRG